MRRRLVSSWISTAISISLVLLLAGVATLLLMNAGAVTDYIRENMQVSVLMKQEVTESEALVYQKTLDAMPGVRRTEFISRERGVEEMSQMLGQDFLDVFESAPVPVSIDLTLEAAYVSRDSIESLRSRIGASPLVEETVCQTTLVDTLNENLSRISLFLGIFMALLLFISVVLIANTVRLNVFSRRFTIHTMQLVGATRSFIRAPFLGRAAFLGLFSALLAVGMLLGGMYLLKEQFAQLFSLFGERMLLMTMGVMVASGVVLCTVSAFFVVNRILGFDKDQLYSTF